MRKSKENFKAARQGGLFMDDVIDTVFGDSGYC